ncbi:MAG: hypothetical protein CBE26_04110 [Kiritimatiellaceae bacterium TMED266]|jgi:Lon protease-like protein|nr:MAG: hypothetical protein CBE26_04110 [Kiritimatiellaceae bacterium TMED266]|tara:strand:+ start:1517 stop:2095 length:579 start_codon:yes stop_codon:yes gene_type:complete
MNVQIPKHVPMMVLPGVLLLPHQLMPLHIFEEKYKQMLEDVIHGDRIFGICDDTIYSPMHRNRIASVGLLHISEKQDDETSNLMLLGLQKVFIKHVSEERDYPLVEVEPVELPSIDKRQHTVIKEHLIERVNSLLPESDQAAEVLNNMQKMSDLDLMIDYASQLINAHPTIQRKIYQTLNVEEKLALFDDLF